MEKRKVVAKVDMSKLGLPSRPPSGSSTTPMQTMNGFVVKAKVNSNSIVRSSSVASTSRPKSPSRAVATQSRATSNMSNISRPSSKIAFTTLEPSSAQRIQASVNGVQPLALSSSPVLHPSMSPPTSVTSDDSRSAVSNLSLPSPPSPKFCNDLNAIDRINAGGSIRVKAKVSGGIKALAANSQQLPRSRATSVVSSNTSSKTLPRPRLSPISALQFQSFPHSNASYDRLLPDEFPPYSQSPPNSSLSSRSSHSAASSIITSSSSIPTAMVGFDEFEGFGSLQESTAEPSLENSILEPWDQAAREAEEEAKSNRKILDLEISNKSLLAVNTMLEATKLRQSREIRDLRRKLRESKLHHLAKADVQLPSPPVEQEIESSSEEEEAEDLVYERCKGMLEALLQGALQALEDLPITVTNPLPKTKVLTAAEVERYERGGAGDPDTSIQLDEDHVSVADTEDGDMSLDDTRPADLPSSAIRSLAPPSPKITSNAPRS